MFDDDCFNGLIIQMSSPPMSAAYSSPQRLELLKRIHHSIVKSALDSVLDTIYYPDPKSS